MMGPKFMALCSSIFAIHFLALVKSDDNFQINMSDWLIDYTKRVSNECALQLNISLQTFAWLQMIDASAKSLDGLLVGSYFHLGNFDECYNILVQNSKKNVYGKYCLGVLGFTSGLNTIPYEGKIGHDHFQRILNSPVKLPNQRLQGDKSTISTSLPIYLGICLPSGCSANDANNFTNNFIQFFDEYCYSKDLEPELTTGAIITIAILVTFLAMAVISTSYDVVLFYKKSSPYHPLCVAFSVFTNGRKLIKASKNPDQLLCLNGIKAISMMWVILGHTYSISTSSAVNNMFDMVDWISQGINMFIMGATVSVDTFFMVGGLLVTYTFLKASDKGTKFNIPLYYLHRYIRLTPALAINMLIFATLLKYFDSGPLWGAVTTGMESCQKNWWINLLYIQNYYHADFCLGHAWYLAVDMQLFLLSPFILLPLKRWPKLTLYFMGVLVVLGVVIDFVISKVYSLTNVLLGGEDYAWIYYIPMHTRYNVYLIGMIVGYFIYKHRNSGKPFSLSPIYVLVLWLIVLTGLVACVFAGHNNFMNTTDVWENALYNALNRPAWAVAVAGVIYLCITGYGGPINSFLSHAIFQFLAKVSYSMYLVHYLVILIESFSLRSPIYINNFDYMLRFWGYFMYNLLVSIICCLIFESPVIIIEKLLFAREKREKKSVEISVN